MYFAFCVFALHIDHMLCVLCVLCIVYISYAKSASCSLAIILCVMLLRTRRRSRANGFACLPASGHFSDFLRVGRFVLLLLCLSHSSGFSVLLLRILFLVLILYFFLHILRYMFVTFLSLSFSLRSSRSPWSENNYSVFLYPPFIYLTSFLSLFSFLSFFTAFCRELCFRG